MVTCDFFSIIMPRNIDAKLAGVGRKFAKLARSTANLSDDASDNNTVTDNAPQINKTSTGGTSLPTLAAASKSYAKPDTATAVPVAAVPLVRAALQDAARCKDALKIPAGWGITRLPAEVEDALAYSGTLDGLTTLDIGNQKLDRLPSLDAVAETLLQLSFAYNEVERVPPTMAQRWGALEQLDVGHNRLKVLPSELGATCVRLTKLSASHNELESLPDAFSSLVRITALDISSNRLQAIPRCVENFMLLEVLHANHNDISGLFEKAERLLNLCELVLHHNQLVGIARTWPLAMRRSLRRLELNDNVLQFLPPELGLCERLVGGRFTVGCNPLLFPPVRICRSGVAKVLEYLRGHLDAAEEVEVDISEPLPQPDAIADDAMELPDGPCKLCAPGEFDPSLLQSGGLTGLSVKQALAVAENEIETLKASLIRKDRQVREQIAESEKAKRAWDLREKVLQKSVIEKAQAADRIQREMASHIKELSELRKENDGLREISKEAAAARALKHQQQRDPPPPHANDEKSRERVGSLERERDTLVSRVASLESELSASESARRTGDAQASRSAAALVEARREAAARDERCELAESKLESVQEELRTLRKEIVAARDARASAEAKAKALVAETRVAGARIVSAQGCASVVVSSKDDDGMDGDIVGSLPTKSSLAKNRVPGANAPSKSPASGEASGSARAAGARRLGSKRILSGRDAARWQDDIDRTS